ncbi:MAG: OsmC family protein, partial [Deltaproteobacteria bacterium]|nr:OsmC family protein [Deltaproteobacteria bacterium]
QDLSPKSCIRLHFDLATSASEEQLATLVRLTERYCVVYQTLRRLPEVSVSRRIAPSNS